MYRDRYRYQDPTPYKNHTGRDVVCGTAPDFKNFFSMGMEERSRFAEDMKIYEIFFKDTRVVHTNKGTETATTHGTIAIPAAAAAATPKIGSIVEMGAFDGIRESNSRFFDLCLGWNTLLVEGNPAAFDKLTQNRPHAHTFNYIPSCNEEEELANKTIKIANAVFTNMAIRHDNITTYLDRYKEDHQIWSNVPCGSLTKVLLDVFPNGHVSFFSLDVEGSEPMILEKLELHRVYVEIFMIESFNSGCQEKCDSRDRFRKIMINAGYHLFPKVVRNSYIFIHPSSSHLKTAREKGLFEAVRGGSRK